MSRSLASAFALTALLGLTFNPATTAAQCAV